MRAFEVVLFAFCFVIVVSGMLGCEFAPTGLPPKPETVHGETDQGQHFTFLGWESGLRLLVVDNFKGPLKRKSEFQLGDGSAYVFSEKVVSEELEMSWELKTTQGETGTFQLDGIQYDLKNGSVFVATQGDDGIVVQQINADLSALEVKEQEIATFVSNSIKPTVENVE